MKDAGSREGLEVGHLSWAVRQGEECIALGWSGGRGMGFWTCHNSWASAKGTEHMHL